MVVHGLGNEDVNSLQDMGCHLVRRDLGWDTIEVAPGVWNFNGSYFQDGSWVYTTPTGQPLRNLDAEFNRSAAANVKILLIFDYTPLWAIDSRYLTENESAGGDTHLPPDPVAWRSMVHTVMEHYAYDPALYGFEVWNEPSGWFLHGPNKDADYLQLLSIAMEETVSLNTAFSDHPIKLFATDWAHFHDKVTNASVLQNLDGAAWHYYGFLPEGVREDFLHLNQTKPRADFKLLITEAGYPIGTGFTRDSFRVDEITQAARLVETYAVFSEYLDACFWYKHRGDDSFSIDNPFLPVPLPAYRAFQEITYALRNTNHTAGEVTEEGRVPLTLEANRLETHIFLGQSNATAVFWTRGPSINIAFKFGTRTGDFQGKVPTSARLIDIASNVTETLTIQGDVINCECGSTPKILMINMTGVTAAQMQINYSLAGGFEAFLGFGLIGVILACGIVKYIRVGRQKKR